MAAKLQFRRDTAANWAAVNPVLSIGEPGVEIDTKKMKIGDGVTAWNALSYALNSGEFFDSIEMTGVPIAPTAPPGTNTTQVATTEFVQGLIPSGQSPGKVLASDGTNLTWIDAPGVPIVWGWNHNNDEYGYYYLGSSTKVSDVIGEADIDVQSRMRRCILNDAGEVVYYLDADDSTLKAGPWLRIVETQTLDVPYTGAVTTETPNSILRTGVPSWAAGTFTKGQRVIHNGSLWECVVNSTTAEPAAGTDPSLLDGTDGQVMVEVPAFSVRYGFSAGVHTREIRLGCSDALIAQGFQPHPAFIRVDGSYKPAFYFGAYHAYSDGTNLFSISGQENTRSLSRVVFRNRAAVRGTGWHIISHYEYAAIATLLVTEYRDMNSQKVIGSGISSVPPASGLSNNKGNRSANLPSEYSSYRGVENIHGGGFQILDGVNIFGTSVYVTSNHLDFKDASSEGYEYIGKVPPGVQLYIKEIYDNPFTFIPLSTGASSNTYTGSGLWGNENNTWRMQIAGGGGQLNLHGVLLFHTTISHTSALAVVGSRLSFSEV